MASSGDLLCTRSRYDKRCPLIWPSISAVCVLFFTQPKQAHVWSDLLFLTIVCMTNKPLESARRRGLDLPSGGLIWFGSWCILGNLLKGFRWYQLSGLAADSPLCQWSRSFTPLLEEGWIMCCSSTAPSRLTPTLHLIIISILEPVQTTSSPCQLQTNKFSKFSWDDFVKIHFHFKEKNSQIDRQV